MTVLAAERFAIECSDAKIEYYARGKGALVVLLPSLGRGAEDFAQVGSRLAQTCRVVTPQPRGIGASRGPMTGVTLHDYARDIAAVIEKEGCGPAIVGGHAFGNFVARTLATDRPELVLGVALIGATHVWPVPSDVRESILKSSDLSLPDDDRMRYLKH